MARQDGLSPLFPTRTALLKRQLRTAGFTIDKVIGRGAWAETWLATEDRTRSPVAVKLPRAHEREDLFLSALGQFRNEEKKLRRLPSHTNLVQLRYLGDVERLPYAVYEYYPRTLEDIQMATPQGTPLSEVVKMGTQVLSGLEAVHGCDLLHKDIHPGNIFISREGTYKIGDFGLSRTITTTSKGFKLVSADIEFANSIGCVEFMPPEHPTENPSPAFDLFSTALVLLRSLTTFTWNKRYAWSADELRSAFAAQRPNEAEEVVEFFCKGLAVDPASRFSSAGTMKSGLDGLSANELGVKTLPPSASKSVGISQTNQVSNTQGSVNITANGDIVLESDTQRKAKRNDK